MTDIFDMAAQRTPLRIINEGPLASRSRPVPAEDQVYEPASVPAHVPPAAPEPLPSRVPRKRVRAALASLLAFLFMAGAYWYVTGVHVTDDPYVYVGESGISTAVSGTVKNVDVACSSSSCVRSPRSRLSPERSSADRRAARVISTWRLSSPPSPQVTSADLDDNGRILLLDVARHMLISLQQGRGY
jgi:hypothetical protein